MAFAPDYVDVAERIREFREKHPEGSLQQVDWRIETIGQQHFVVYTAAAYRTPDDERPGIGAAWEPFPGRTSFTRDSELQNAETSAWGRAIIAAGAADAKRVASANEVANRQADAQALDAAFSGATTTTPPTTPQNDVQTLQNEFSATIVDTYTFSFGKHKGKTLQEVPADYLDWLLRQPAKEGFESQHADAHAMYRRELHRREQVPA